MEQDTLTIDRALLEQDIRDAMQAVRSKYSCTHDALKPYFAKQLYRVYDWIGMMSGAFEEKLSGFTSSAMALYNVPGLRQEDRELVAKDMLHYGLFLLMKTQDADYVRKEVEDFINKLR